MVDFSLEIARTLRLGCLGAVSLLCPRALGLEALCHLCAVTPALPRDCTHRQVMPMGQQLSKRSAEAPRAAPNERHSSKAWQIIVLILHCWDLAMCTFSEPRSIYDAIPAATCALGSQREASIAKSAEHSQYCAHAIQNHTRSRHAMDADGSDDEVAPAPILFDDQVRHHRMTSCSCQHLSTFTT